MTRPGTTVSAIRHRRVAALAAALAIVGGAGIVTASTASADERPAPTGSSDADGYWACLAVEHVDIGTCIRNPLPDLSGVPSVPETVGDLLG